MLTTRLLGATMKPAVGTPGSAAVERGFDVSIESTPKLETYRVALVWTADGWNKINHTECHLAEVHGNSDFWTGGISFFSERPTTFFYALVASGPEGLAWDNNQGWNYLL